MNDQAILELLPIAAQRVRLRKQHGSPFKRLPLYPKQAAIVDDPARFVITEATSKAGKTMCHIERMLERGIAANQGHWWWVATVYSTADIAFRRAQERLRGFIDSRGELKQVATPIAYGRNKTDKTITVGGATFWFKSADKPDHLFGEDVREAECDEISRWRDESWHAVYTTLTATGGGARLIGNVKGRRNVGFKLAREAQAGKPNWGYHKLTCEDAIEGGILERDIIEQARGDLPSAVFQELYMAQASDDEGNPFGLDAIRSCIGALSDLKPVVWGWDLAKSTDWTVGIGLDKHGRCCRFERFQLPWQLTLDRIALALETTRGIIDSTGVGDPIVEALQSRGLPVEGYLFTAKSKQQLMEGLAVTIQQRGTSYPEGAISAELEAFEYEYTRTGVKYSAPSGVHDDCVCALALAVHGMNSAPREYSTADELDAVTVEPLPERW